MLYSIGPVIVIVGVAAFLIYLWFTRRRFTPRFLALSTLPALAAGAASGHWAAVAGMLLIIAAVPTFQWANSRWPT